MKCWERWIDYKEKNLSINSLLLFNMTVEKERKKERKGSSESSEGRWLVLTSYQIKEELDVYQFCIFILSHAVLW